MVTWEDLVAYVRSNYKIADEQPGMLQLIFEVSDGRSQLVYLWRRELLGIEEWVQIESPIGPLDEIDTRALLSEAGDKVCGAVAATDTIAFYRHSVPLAHLDINEFERPFQLVINTADALERKFCGGDRF
jgi:hypothetical protein